MLGWPSPDALQQVRDAGHQADAATDGSANTRLRITNDLAAIVAIARGDRDADACLVPDGPPSTSDPDGLLLLLAADRLGVPILGWPSLHPVDIPRIQKTAVDVAREEAELALWMAVRQSADAARDFVPQTADHHNLDLVPANIASVVGNQLTNILIQLHALKKASAPAEMIGRDRPDGGTPSIMFTFGG